jgi:hypothetical protein
MALTHEENGRLLMDVLDRILDKGIVIDAWVRVSLSGIDFLIVEARVVVASLETYLRCPDATALTDIGATHRRSGLTRRSPRSHEIRRTLSRP